MLLLAVVGFSLIVVRSKLFASIRDHRLAPKTLLHCLQCFSFWAGLAIGILEFNQGIKAFMLAFQASAIGWLLGELFPKPIIRQPKIGE